MKVVGLTGGIACGKSTVAKMLAELGAEVLSADADARSVLSDGSSTLDAVHAAFPEAFNETGHLVRAELARVIFADPLARAQLEAITHPAIIARMEQAVSDARQNPKPNGVLVYETPLLYEANLERLFDVVVATVASPDVQASRLQEREKAAGRPPLSVDEIAHRLQAQIPVDEKARRADFVIRTDVPIEETRGAVGRLWGEAFPTQPPTQTHPAVSVPPATA